MYISFPNNVLEFFAFDYENKLFSYYDNLIESYLRGQINSENTLLKPTLVTDPQKYWKVDEIKESNYTNPLTGKHYTYLIFKAINGSKSRYVFRLDGTEIKHEYDAPTEQKITDDNKKGFFSEHGTLLIFGSITIIIGGIVAIAAIKK